MENGQLRQEKEYPNARKKRKLPPAAVETLPRRRARGRREHFLESATSLLLQKYEAPEEEKIALLSSPLSLFPSLNNMMSENRLVKISKYLSYHLRHRPEEIGLELSDGGWVKIDELLAACKKHGFHLYLNELEEVVDRNDKKRFSFDATETFIRANQGHSVDINLQLEAIEPPDVLYHGTAHRAVETIRREGLSKMLRHHVHLSMDAETARNVGKRRGRPVVLAIDAAAMYRDGYAFYCSDNGVWLVDGVPPQYLQQTTSCDVIN